MAKGNAGMLPAELPLDHPRDSPNYIYPLIMETINILAISSKGKSRIGTKMTMAIVEQNHHDKMFVVIPGTSQCRWIKKDNDPDFRIIGDD
jgi:hypothetical protein